MKGEIRLLKQLEKEPEQLIVSKKFWKILIEILDDHRISIEECLYRIKELEQSQKKEAGR